MNQERVSIVYTASQSWFGRAIRWFTKSKASHVYIEFPVWGRRMAIEATIGGTRLVLAKKARHDVHQEFATAVNKRVALASLVEYLGTEYDYTGVLVMAWLKIAWRWLRLKTTKVCWSTKALKCSELVVYFIRSMELGDAFEQLDPETSTPGELMEWMSQRPKEYKLIDVDTA
jgi:hypothetical protein